MISCRVARRAGVAPRLDPLAMLPLTSTGPMRVPSVFLINLRFRVIACGSLSLVSALLVAALLLTAPLQAQQAKPAAPALPIATFTDIADKAGLTAQNIFGGLDTKKYIIETTGTGVAIFDYDNDGWPDIFPGERHEIEDYPPGRPDQPPLSQQS